MGVLILPYLLAQYFWFAVICLPLISLIPFGSTRTTKDFFSSTDSVPWSDEKDPTWFLHVTDLYLNARDPKGSTATFEKFKFAVDLIQPEKIFVSGGVASNEELDAKMFKYRRQHKEDWDLFEKLVESTGVRDKMFVTAGSNDVFNVKSYDSGSNYARAILGDEDGYQMRVTDFKSGNDTFRVVTLNPYQFPTASYRLTNWVFPTIELRRRLYDELVKPDAPITIVMAHHPASMWYPTYDTTRSNAMSMILIASQRTRFYLTGHVNHGDAPMFMHHGNALEVVGTSLAKVDRVGVITFDNNRAMYHNVYLNRTLPLVLLTNPVVTQQTSGLDVFNEKKMSIRALVFSDREVTLIITGEGINDTLKLERHVATNVALYSLQVELPFGAHHFAFSGDWTGSIDFSTGNTIVGFTEAEYVTQGTTSYQFLFALFYIFIVFITLPIDVTGIGWNFDRWLNGHDTLDSHWQFAFFGGFIAIKNRFSQMPLWFRVSTFVATVWPLFLPAAFFSIDGNVAMLWLWGYVCEWRCFRLFIGFRLGFMYLVFVLMPILFMASAVTATSGRSIVLILDFIIYFGALCGNGYAIYLLCDVGGFVAGATSPMFVFIPLILHVMLWIACKKLLDRLRHPREEETNFITSHSQSFI